MVDLYIEEVLLCVVIVGLALWILGPGDKEE